jgi:UDP-glucose 4-epimerase
LYGLPIVNARFFNVFGPGEVPGRYRNVIPNFFYWAMKNLFLERKALSKESTGFYLLLRRRRGY